MAPSTDPSNVWHVRHSKSKNMPYYHNASTGESVWEAPASPPAVIIPAPVISSSASLSGGPQTVKASHLLVKHAQSRNPSSWKDAKITRNVEEATALIQEYTCQITTSPDPAAEFVRLASKESDCSSAKRGGDLGPFKRGQMQKAFEDAAFSMAIGEFRSPVYSDSGVHLIFRTA